MELDDATPDDQRVVEVEIRALVDADSPRTKGVDMEHAEMLAAAHSELPPIIVHRQTMRVVDGMHRLMAARLRQQTTIAVRFFDGSESDAFVAAVKANIAHGLPLSMADRKEAARRIIATQPQWSDRKIASVSGISAVTVMEIRKLFSGTLGENRTRIGKDGRVRPVDGSEGRRIASELIAENPTLSLRQIARAAGISPETARDVKNRMRQGQDPLVRRESRTAAARAGSTAASAGSVAVKERALAARRIDRQSIHRNTMLAERLHADPALRFSKAGRDLLRLLDLHSMGTESWERMLDNIPAHARHLVSQLAAGCAEVWLTFAAQVEEKSAKQE